MALRDYMKDYWLNIPHTTNLKNWYKKWFNVNHNEEGRPVPYEVTQIPVANERWKARPDDNEMIQVNELLGEMDFRNLDGVCVGSTFVIRRIQPLRERNNYMFDFQGENDPCRQSPLNLTLQDLNESLGKMFEHYETYRAPDQIPRPYDWTFPRPPVCLFVVFAHCYFDLHYC